MKNKILLLIIILSCVVSINLKAASTTNEQISIENPHNYPNPFNNNSEVTKIKFNIISEKINTVNIVIVIYDFNGKKVWTKRETENISVGSTPKEIPWGGENDLGERMAKGLYYGKIIIEGPNTKVKVIKILVK